MSIFKPRNSKAAGSITPAFAGTSPWRTLFHYRGDHFPGAWQRDVRISTDEMLRNPNVFGAMSQIASDVGKMRVRLMTLSAPGGFWSETSIPAYSPFVTKPNGYQTQRDFLESWLWSVLGHGNFYGLKERDNRGVVVNIWPLDPFRVMPLVANDGSSAVFYALSPDNMAGIMESVTVPAREIVHHRINTIWHPLMGVSPLVAAAASAAVGIAAMNGQANFLRQGAQPSGVLVAPGSIDPDTVKRLEDRWENDFTGPEAAGKIAVLGSGLKFEKLSLSAVDSQLAESMKWSAIEICAAFGLPPWKLGLDVLPRGSFQVEDFQVIYLTDCLQRYVVGIEQVLTDGLSLSSNLRVSLDETSLLRMNQTVLAEYLGGLVQKGIISPNEARAKLGYGPIAGGENAFMQQQMWPLTGLSDPARGAAPGASGGAPSSGGAPAQTLMMPGGQQIDIGAEVRKHLPRAPDTAPLAAEVKRAREEAAAARADAVKAANVARDAGNGVTALVEHVNGLVKHIDSLRAGAVDTIEERDEHGRLVSTMTRTTRL
jgi:HK97 family phage portal protein